jgi:hypothetical protein
MRQYSNAEREPVRIGLFAGSSHTNARVSQCQVRSQYENVYLGRIHIQYKQQRLYENETVQVDRQTGPLFNRINMLVMRGVRRELEFFPS